METWEAVTSRRNVRDYTGDPIEPAVMDRILEAGRRAPSSRNGQPWDFVVVTDRDQLVELAKVWGGARHVARSAATVAIVTDEPDDDGRSSQVEFDLGQAVMQMMIVATGMDIGSAHAWVVDQDQARRVLGLPEGKRLAWMVAFGHPADRPLRPIENPKRRPFEEVVHRERW